MALKTVLMGVCLTTAALDYGIRERMRPMRELAVLSRHEEVVLARVRAAHPCGRYRVWTESDASVRDDVKCAVAAAALDELAQGRASAFGMSASDLQKIRNVWVTAAATPHMWHAEVSIATRPQTLVLEVDRATGLTRMSAGTHWR